MASCVVAAMARVTTDCEIILNKYKYINYALMTVIYIITAQLQ
jgi:hypothetical protein